MYKKVPSASAKHCNTNSKCLFVSKLAVFTICKTNRASLHISIIQIDCSFSTIQFSDITTTLVMGKEFWIFGLETQDRFFVFLAAAFVCDKGSRPHSPRARNLFFLVQNRALCVQRAHIIKRRFWS